MIKRLTASIIILLISAFLSFYSLFYLNTVKNNINAYLASVSDYFEKCEYTAAAQKADGLYNYYSSISSYLVVFLEHERLEELEETLSRLSPLIGTGDTGEFSAELSKAFTLTDKLYDHEQPKLKNIL